MTVNAPDTYQQYETDWRDPEVVAMMALIDQMEEMNGHLKELVDLHGYENR